MSTNSSDAEARFEKALTFVTQAASEHAFPLLLETALTSIFTVMLVYFLFQRWPIRRGTSIWPLGLALCMYTLATGMWALDIVILSQYLYRGTAYELSITPDPEIKSSFLRVLDGVQLAENLLTQAIYIMSDLITLWRVYIVYQRPKWLLCLLIFTGLLETGCSAGFIDATQYVGQYQSEVHFEVVVKALYVTVAASTTACQVFASTMIGYKAWSHWKEIKEFVGPTNSRRTIHILVLIVETGLIYAALWIWFVLIWAYNAHDITAFYWSGYYMITLSAMYPTLIVMLASAHGSIVERSVYVPSRASAIDIVIPAIASAYQAELSHSSPEGPDMSQAFTDLRCEQKIEQSVMSAKFPPEKLTTSTPDSLAHNELIV
ncbi:unnamed protein product [Peniophora sp. CBMAI 1063]|nr:unnamed protein product [Peniophora sp. CBMAI 1063]